MRSIFHQIFAITVVSAISIGGFLVMDTYTDVSTYTYQSEKKVTFYNPFSNFSVKEFASSILSGDFLYSRFDVNNVASPVMVHRSEILYQTEEEKISKPLEPVIATIEPPKSIIPPISDVSFVPKEIMQTPQEEIIEVLEESFKEFISEPADITLGQEEPKPIYKKTDIPGYVPGFGGGGGGGSSAPSDTTSPTISSFSILECDSSLVDDECVVGSESIHLSFSYPDDDIESIEVVVDGNVEGTVNSSGDVFNISSGSHAVAIKLTDNSGNETNSSSVSVEYIPNLIIVIDIGYHNTATTTVKWITLYNNSDKTINLSNISIGTSITLSGGMESGKYVLVEQGYDSSSIVDPTDSMCGGYDESWNLYSLGEEISIVHSLDSTLDIVPETPDGSNNYEYRERVDNDTSGSDVLNWTVITELDEDNPPISFSDDIFVSGILLFCPQNPIENSVFYNFLSGEFPAGFIPAMNVFVNTYLVE